MIMVVSCKGERGEGPAGNKKPAEAAGRKNSGEKASF
jgi:hypothetical protein